MESIAQRAIYLPTRNLCLGRGPFPPQIGLALIPHTYAIQDEAPAQDVAIPYKVHPVTLAQSLNPNLTIQSLPAVNSNAGAATSASKLCRLGRRWLTTTIGIAASNTERLVDSPAGGLTDTLMTCYRVPLIERSQPRRGINIPSCVGTYPDLHNSSCGPRELCPRHATNQQLPKEDLHPTSHLLGIMHPAI